MNLEIKTADNALVFIAERNLLADELPHAAFPTPVEIGLVGVVGNQAKAIAEISFLDLAREAQDCLAAMSASYFDFVLPALSRLKSLPLAVALIIAASAAYVFFGITDLERLATYGTTEGNVTSFVVAVMHAAVLMKIYVSALLTR